MLLCMEPSSRDQSSARETAASVGKGSRERFVKSFMPSVFSRDCMVLLIMEGVKFMISATFV